MEFKRTVSESLNTEELKETIAEALSGVIIICKKVG